jgi:hypothetical protein
MTSSAAMASGALNRLADSIRRRPHESLNSLGVIFAVLFGVCTLQGQAADRAIAAANRVRDLAAQSSQIKANVLRFGAVRVDGTQTYVRVDLRVGNTGGSPTTLVSATSSEFTATTGRLTLKDLPAAFGKVESKSGTSTLEVTDPPAPSHALTPPPRIDAHGVVDFTIEVSTQAVAGTLVELGQSKQAQEALGVVEIIDVDGQTARVILWDCAPKAFQAKRPTCSGPLFDLLAR